MTEAEKNEIVGLVMTEISSQAVDFDIATEQPQANDLLTAVRESESGGYRGVTIKWDDVARIATELANQAVKKAEQAKTDAVNAKNIAQEILTGVQSKGTEITNFVATSKTELDNQKNESVNAVKSVYQTDLDELKGDLGDVEDRIAPIDFRQKSNGKVILDVDVTGTMGNFVDGMEQEPNEAIALTLEPDVPTVDTHNFGVRGQICIDGNYLYVCVADNTWKKIPLQEL